MKSYSEREIFSAEAISIWEKATRLVAAVRSHLDAHGEEIRCHEIARALGWIFHKRVIDGQSVGVDHSWLMIDETTLLDPYAPARHPMVELVSIKLPTLARFYYIAGERAFERTDVRDDVVARLLEEMGAVRWSQ